MTTTPPLPSPAGAASASLFRAAPASSEEPSRRQLRETLFVPGPAHLAKAAAPREIAEAARDTEAWLDRMLRPEVARPLREAVWHGLRKGVAEEVNEDCVYGAADTPLGPLQVLGFSKRLVLRARVVSPSASGEPRQRLSSALTTADGLFREAIPRNDEAWYAVAFGEFVSASSLEDPLTNGWKSLSILTDGHGVAFLVNKLPEGLNRYKAGQPLQRWLEPDPNWFAKPGAPER